jgi:hypothetical protein
LTTHVRLAIIQEEKFLRQIYQEWYRALAASFHIVKEPCRNWEQAQGLWRITFQI